MIALLGSSGSGKSTLAGLAAMSLTPDSGRVLGEIAERGRHEDLIAIDGRYHELYTVQARI